MKLNHKKVFSRFKKKVDKEEVIRKGFLLIVILLAAGAGFLGGRISVKEQNPVDKEGAKLVTFSPQKERKPNVKFFVMSFCPFGNQAEEGLKKVFDLLGDKVQWEPHYIVSKYDVEEMRKGCQQRVYSPSRCRDYVKKGYFQNEKECRENLYSSVDECLRSQGEVLGDKIYVSLHGAGELHQDVREICVWEQTDDKKKWWQFVSLVNKNCTAQDVDSCWEKQAKDAGLAVDKIKECAQSQAQELLDKEIAVVSKYQVTGSPTFIFNESRYPPQGAYPRSRDEKVKMKIGKSVFTPEEYRQPETLKTAICAGWKRPPKECKEKLSEVAGPKSGGC